jgi:hypothetical protein
VFRRAVLFIAFFYFIFPGHMRRLGNMVGWEMFFEKPEMFTF